ncbi:hypothetical protein AB0948_29380 [Streptomyces koyangensis]|uniref:hypothetical protein n=1 Tax=Streptomyces koyangensis TaxID=188770 RepID=UPI003454826A
METSLNIPITAFDKALPTVATKAGEQMLPVAPAFTVPEALLERATELEAAWYTPPLMWHGPSGTPVTGEQTAAHLDQARSVLGREGWLPGEFGLQEALAGPADLTSVSVSVLELVVCALTGAGAAEPRIWDQVPGRTADQVHALLLVGAAYARRQGPCGAPEA